MELDAQLAEDIDVALNLTDWKADGVVTTLRVNYEGSLEGRSVLSMPDRMYPMK
jgi:hypothetical protein